MPPSAVCPIIYCHLFTYLGTVLYRALKGDFFDMLKKVMAKRGRGRREANLETLHPRLYSHPNTHV